MIKSAVVFEGIERVGKRNQLKNKLVYSGTESSFWSSVYNLLSSTYDLDEVSHITILGDGAHWIKAGTKEFEHCNFALDKFHFRQSINHIITDSSIKKILTTNIIGDNRKTFKDVIHALMEYTSSDNRKAHLINYINLRNLYLNNIDIRKLYLDNLYPKELKKKEAKYNFSMFEPKTRYGKSSTSNWIKGFISKN